ncbi:hypothetical protein AMELA_G00026410 [Ameiurus melas]|uniref:Uncharacterized protein n=1 Tax=Ameiurus melas TaxID=219545 RepID=A0A7J6BE56_AMEME|nr:hypothetical protein AMELA_G00026410 [Ameiurus melas]
MQSAKRIQILQQQASSVLSFGNILFVPPRQTLRYWMRSCACAQSPRVHVFRTSALVEVIVSRQKPGP